MLSQVLQWAVSVRCEEIGLSGGWAKLNDLCHLRAIIVLQEFHWNTWY